MSDARSWRSSGSSRIAGGPIRPTVAPGGEPHRLATVAGLRLVGGASKALSGCRRRIAAGSTRTQVHFYSHSVHRAPLVDGPRSLASAKLAGAHPEETSSHMRGPLHSQAEHRRER